MSIIYMANLLQDGPEDRSNLPAWKETISTAQ